MMKRSLPQWLLDATNNNDKSQNTNRSKTIRKTSKSPTETRNDNCINENDPPEQHNFNAKSAESDRVPNGTINIVPIANLLSPSRCGVPVIDSSIHSSEYKQNTNEEMNERIQRTESSSNLGVSTNELQSVIKTEKVDDIDPSTSNLNGTTANEHPVVIKTEIKDEPADTATNVPTVKVESVEVKPERPSCNYGIKCFRRNPTHRTEMAHPGDVDYRRPSFPDAPLGTPLCPWGAACYRRNRQHFMQLSHPPASVYNPLAAATTMNVNVNAMPQTTSRRNRQSNQRVINNVDSDEEDDYDLEDPFLDDGSSDEYVPDEVDDETDDDLEHQGS